MVRCMDRCYAEILLRKDHPVVRNDFVRHFQLNNGWVGGLSHHLRTKMVIDGPLLYAIRGEVHRAAEIVAMRQNRSEHNPCASPEKLLFRSKLYLSGCRDDP